MSLIFKDILGVDLSMNSVDMQDSTDTCYVINISDGTKVIEITIIYGKIKEIRSSFK